MLRRMKTEFVEREHCPITNISNRTASTCNQSTRHFRKQLREEKGYDIEVQDLRSSTLRGVGAHLGGSSSGKRCRKAREKQVDTAANANAYKEPHMAAALQHLRQAEEELEKANNEHGGFRQEALKQTQQAEQTTERGIQWYNANVLNKKK